MKMMKTDEDRLEKAGAVLWKDATTNLKSGPSDSVLAFPSSSAFIIFICG
jgi:hypothetical protein